MYEEEKKKEKKEKTEWKNEEGLINIYVVNTYQYMFAHFYRVEKKKGWESARQKRERRNGAQSIPSPSHSTLTLALRHF